MTPKEKEIRIIHNDNRIAIQQLIDEGIFIDSIVCDPPYELGFMGKKWDNSGIAYDVELWKLCLQILNPGGHLVSFGGSRTYHRMACAIEDAGFEIRDQIMWIYGSGFPKSKSALKPAHEPIVLARKPLSEKTMAENVIIHGTGGINIDICKVNRDVHDISGWSQSGSKETVNNCMRGKNYQREARPDNDQRFPANIIHDGSEEVYTAFAKYGMKKSGTVSLHHKVSGKETIGTFKIRPRTGEREIIGDSGSVSRFFYAAKASKKDRAGSKHPTIKPLSLMQYLCRLVTPSNGLILDPFAGSGSTGQAALQENFSVILIEKESQYIEDIKHRISQMELDNDTQGKRDTPKAKE